MTDQNRTARMPETASPQVDDLALRPTTYREAGKGSHPDQRPCPPWCWVGSDAEHDHEIDAHCPLLAHHSLDPSPAVVASRYRGIVRDGVVNTATIEPRLHQLGQGAAVVDVNLRRYDREGRMVFTPDALLLGLEDAADLARLLLHLVNVAEGRCTP